jgi:hypothetical protein
MSTALLFGIASLLIACGGSSSRDQKWGTVLSSSAYWSLRDAFSSGYQACLGTSTGLSCAWPVSAVFHCPQGGTISPSGSVSGWLDSTGEGQLPAQFTLTPTNCSVDGTVLNGTSDITVSGQVTFANTSPRWPTTLKESGGFSFGPSPSGTCQMDVSTTVNSNSCTFTGTVCGQSVSGNC